MKRISNDFQRSKKLRGSTKIRIAVAGFGKLGKACADEIKQRKEFELAGIFSRRATEGTISLYEIEKYKCKIDVLLVCVGSSDDAPNIVPKLARSFNTVDSFDTHSKLPEYISSIKTKRTCIVATGWDPGLLSIIRLYLTASMNDAAIQTFWGKGVSMGHTNAIKQIQEVRDAIQFTVPKPAAILQAKKGITVPPKDRHKRVCYVVADDESVADKIKQIPNYFKDQETEINFVKSIIQKTNHAGQVFAAGENSSAHFKLELKDNALFTAQVMLSYAIANYNLQRSNHRGVFTVADIAPKYLFLDNSFRELI